MQQLHPLRNYIPVYTFNSLSNSSTSIVKLSGLAPAGCEERKERSKSDNACDLPHLLEQVAVNDDRVACAQEGVLFGVGFAFQYLLHINRQHLHSTVFVLAKDGDTLAAGFKYSARHRDRIEHAQRARHDLHARSLHIAEHAYLRALCFEKRQCQARLSDVFGDCKREVFLNLRHRLSDHRHIAEQRKINTAYGRNGYALDGIFRVLVNVYSNDVAGAETIRIIEALIDGVYLRLYRRFF